MTATNRIVLFGAPRTGTTLLRTLMNSRKHALFEGELFHRKNAKLTKKLGPLLAAEHQGKEARDADPVAYLERLAEACPEPIFGFKWNLGHSTIVRDHVVDSPHWQVVVLYRDNVLAMYASGLRASASGEWNRNAAKAKAGGDAPAVTPKQLVTFDEAEFELRRTRYIAYLDGLIRHCAKIGKRFELVEYGELQRPELVANLGRHLGFPEPQTFKSSIVKSGSRDVLSRFDNPDAAMAAIDRLGRPDWAREPGPRFALAGDPPPELGGEPRRKPKRTPEEKAAKAAAKAARLAAKLVPEAPAG